jgi:hypothetical protein
MRLLLIAHSRFTRCAALAGLFTALAASGVAQTRINDTFSDGNLGTNTGGTGAGFTSRGTSLVTESGGALVFQAGGYNTQVIASNSANAFNPFTAGLPTTLTATFGTLGFDPSFNRQWFGYGVTGVSDNHWNPPSRGGQGLFLSILYNNAGEDGTFGNATAHRGNLIAISSTGALTTLASWDWATHRRDRFKLRARRLLRHAHRPRHDLLEFQRQHPRPNRQRRRQRLHPRCAQCDGLRDPRALDLRPDLRHPRPRRRHHPPPPPKQRRAPSGQLIPNADEDWTLTGSGSRSC